MKVVAQQEEYFKAQILWKPLQDDVVMKPFQKEVFKPKFAVWTKDRH